MEEHTTPRHKQNSWIHIRTIISAREDKRRKIHSQNWNIIAPYAFQQPSTTGALHNPCLTAPCCISTWKDIWQCLGEKMFLFFFFFLMLMLFPSFKGTFDYETCSAQGWRKMFLSVPTNDKNRSIDLLVLWPNENLKEWLGHCFVSCLTDKIACSAETWCLTAMAGTLKSVLGEWPYKNHSSAYEMKNTAL